MSHVIALAGKGGTGKTTVATLLVRLFKEIKKGSILAVDADPNSNLPEALGLKIKETMGQILDDIAASLDKIPAGMPKERFIEYRIQTAIAEGDGFDLLVMGRPEGPGCYCYVNNVLRNIMAKLIKDYDYVIIDNEAGLEHLSRRTTRHADTLLIVSDATIPGLRAAGRIHDLARTLDIKIGKELLLVNSSDKDIEPQKLEWPGLEYLGRLPYDRQIEKISLAGGALLELEESAASISALRKLFDKI
ncbi:MAG: AAA family ATPase [Candidatus Omnitrophica bacterium]|nr:AAA family ATPase [Candidatus Omnitrophota bacterium]